jgi:hypothetical protein
VTHLTGPVIFRGESSKPHGRARDPGGAARAHAGARARRRWQRNFSRRTFFPEGYTWRQRFTNSVNYYLAAFYFNAFPLPQREGRRAADAGLRRRARLAGLVRPDLSGGRAVGDRRIKPFAAASG